MTRGWMSLRNLVYPICPQCDGSERLHMDHSGDSRITRMINEAETPNLSADDFNLIRQWYNAVQDLAPEYLTLADHDLAKRLANATGWDGNPLPVYNIPQID